jgi:hypothetical protein
MSTLHPFLLICIISISTLFAEDTGRFPDLSKVFPNEDLFMQTKMNGIETYAYATDVEFDKLKRKFSDYLGKKWTEMKYDPEILQSTHEVMKAENMVIEGNSIFTNPDYPGIYVGLTQMKMEVEGKKYMVNITVIPDMSKQANTGQSFTRLEAHAVDYDQPQPKTNGYTVLIGIMSAWYGFYTLLLRKYAPGKFKKLNTMKRIWGDKTGYMIHLVGYSVIPIVLGIVLFFSGMNGASFFGI